MKVEDYEFTRISRDTIEVRSKHSTFGHFAVGGPVFAMYQRILELENEVVEKCETILELRSDLDHMSMTSDDLYDRLNDVQAELDHARSLQDADWVQNG